MASDSYGVFRVRPQGGQQSSGLAAMTLTRIGSLLAGINDDEGYRDTFAIDIPALEDHRRALGEEIGDRLSEMLRQTSNLVIDVAIESIPRPAALEAALAIAWERASSAIRNDHKLLVLVASPLPSTDMWREEMEPHVQDGVVKIISANGSVDGVEAGWTLSEALVAAATVTPADHRRVVVDRFLRRRGVFEGRPDRGPEYVHYWYSSPDSCQSHLGNAIGAFLRNVGRRGKVAVVYDAHLSPWLHDAVLGPCQRQSLSAFELGDLSEAPAELADELRSSLTAADRVVLVLPLIKSGRSLAQARRVLAEYFKGVVRVLAVVFDDTMGVPAAEPAAGTLASMVPDEDEQVRVDYLIPGKQKVLGPRDWQVVSALHAGAVEDPAAPWTTPSTVGMWSLFDSLGVEAEAPFPVDERPPLARMPRLRDIGDLDALWLGESMVLYSEQELRCNRSEMLMVFPEEESGSLPISLAIEKRLDVPVARVPRDVLSGRAELGADASRKLRMYASRFLVVADESTITYSTLSKLREVCRTVSGRPADLGVVALELPIDGFAGRPDWVRSLYSWRPLGALA